MACEMSRFVSCLEVKFYLRIICPQYVLYCCVYVHQSCLNNGVEGHGLLEVDDLISGSSHILSATEQTIRETIKA